jgi:hypothetical protein
MVAASRWSGSGGTPTAGLLRSLASGQLVRRGRGRPASGRRVSRADLCQRMGRHGARGSLRGPAAAAGDIGRLSIHGAPPSASARCGPFLLSRHGNHHTCRVTREPAKTTRSRRHGLNSPQIIARTSRPTVANGARRRRGCFRGVLSAANDQEAAMTYFRSQL